MSTTTMLRRVQMVIASLMQGQADCPVVGIEHVFLGAPRHIVPVANYDPVSVINFD